MNKTETRGRKPLKPSERKSVRISVRCTPGDKDFILKRFKSLQRFFDLCLVSEQEYESRRKLNMCD